MDAKRLSMIEASRDYETHPLWKDTVDLCAEVRRLVEALAEAKDAALWAFLDGAKWWQFTGNGSTAFPSEQNEMLEEAKKRYPFKPHTLVMLAENDRDLALSEAERLRGALKRLCDEIAKVHQVGCESLEEAGVALLGLMAMASSALSRATTATPSSAAPSSEYRREYARAVEDAVEVIMAQNAWIARGGLVVFRDTTVNALRSLLPAPREVGEAEVDRDAETICDVYQDESGVDGMRWKNINERMRNVWRKAIRAVLAAQGEGRGGK